MNRTRKALRAGFYILAIIGVLMTIRRLAVLSGIMPAQDREGFGAFDQGFSEHTLIIVVHIIPGALFMITGLLQFSPLIFRKYRRLHDWSVKLFMASACIIGLTALIIPFIKQTIGGIPEATASVFFSVYFLVCITLALQLTLKSEFINRKDWLIRAFAIGLSISTVRLITAFAFAVFKLPPKKFLGTAFWIGFTLHCILAEVWINYSRREARVIGTA